MSFPTCLEKRRELHANKNQDIAGEYVRTDLVDGQVGVPVHYDFQILDVETCEPVVGKYFEIFSK